MAGGCLVYIFAEVVEKSANPFNSRVFPDAAHDNCDKFDCRSKSAMYTSGMPSIISLPLLRVTAQYSRGEQQEE